MNHDKPMIMMNTFLVSTYPKQLKKMRISLFLMMVLITSCACAKEQLQNIQPGTTFANPVWDGADPWMYKYGADYIYCYSANNSIVLSRSKSMIRKGELKTIWKAPVSGWNRNCVWAPEIHFINGHWYVYMRLVNRGLLLSINLQEFSNQKLRMFSVNMTTWESCIQVIIMKIHPPTFGRSTRRFSNTRTNS